jgi:hypothetical protein
MEISMQNENIDEFEIEEVSNSTPVKKEDSAPREEEANVKDNHELEDIDVEELTSSKNTEFSKLEDDELAIIKKYGCSTKKDKKQIQQLSSEDMELLEKNGVILYDSEINFAHRWLLEVRDFVLELSASIWKKSIEKFRTGKEFVFKTFKTYQIVSVSIILAIVLTIILVSVIKRNNFNKIKTSRISNVKKQMKENRDKFELLLKKYKRIKSIGKFSIPEDVKSHLKKIKETRDEFSDYIKDIEANQYPIHANERKWIIIKYKKSEKIAAKSIKNLYDMSEKYEKIRQQKNQIIQNTLKIEKNNTIINYFLKTALYREKYIKIQFPEKEGYIGLSDRREIDFTEKILKINTEKLQNIKTLYLQNKLEEALKIVPESERNIQDYIKKLKTVNKRIIEIVKVCRAIKKGDLTTKTCLLFVEKNSPIIRDIKKNKEQLPLLISKVKKISNVSIPNELQRKIEIFYTKNLSFSSMEEDFKDISKYIKEKRYTKAISLMGAYQNYDPENLKKYFDNITRELNNIVVLSSKTLKMSKEKMETISRINIILKEFYDINKSHKKITKFFSKEGQLRKKYNQKVSKDFSQASKANIIALKIKKEIENSSDFKLVSESHKQLKTINIFEIKNIKERIKDAEKRISVELILIEKQRKKQRQKQFIGSKLKDLKGKFNLIFETVDEIENRFNILKGKKNISKNFLKRTKAVINKIKTIKEKLLAIKDNMSMGNMREASGIIKDIENIDIEADFFFEIYKIKKYISKKYKAEKKEQERIKMIKEYKKISFLLSSRRNSLESLVNKANELKEKHRTLFPEKSGYIPIYKDTHTLLYSAKREKQDIRNYLGKAEEFKKNKRMLLALQILRPYAPSQMSKEKALKSLIRILQHNIDKNMVLKNNPEMRKKSYRIEEYRKNPGNWYDRLTYHIYQFEQYTKSRQLTRQESFLASTVKNIHLRMRKYPDELGSIFILIDKIKEKKIDLRSKLKDELKICLTPMKKRQILETLRFLDKKTIEITFHSDKIKSIKGALITAKEIDKKFSEKVEKIKSILFNIEGK